MRCSSASADGSLAADGDRRCRPHGPRCRCSRTTSRGCWPTADAGEDRLPRGGAQARSRLRSRAARAVGRASRRRQRTGRARGRRGRSGDARRCTRARGSAWRCRCLQLKRLDDAFATFEDAGRSRADGDADEQPRRHPAAAAGDAADRPRDLLLQSGAQARRGRSGLLLQSRLRLLGREGRTGRDLLAARSRAPQSGRRRRARGARGGAAGNRRRRRSGARARAGDAAVVELCRVGEEAGGPAPSRFRAASSGSSRPRTCPRSAASTARSRRPGSASSRSWRRSISIAAAGSSSRAATARRSTELARAIYLSPYEAEAHLLLGRIYLRTGETAAAIDAFKIALWSQETAEAARRAGPGVPADEGSRRRAGGAAARAGPRSEFRRREGVTRVNWGRERSRSRGSRFLVLVLRFWFWCGCAADRRLAQRSVQRRPSSTPPKSTASSIPSRPNT